MGLYRPTVIRKQPDGTRRREKTALWWGKYFDHAQGRYVAVPLKTPDKSSAKIAFNRIQRNAATEADRPFAKHAARPLTEHVEEWAEALGAKCGDQHVAMSLMYALKVFGGCKFTTWRDVAASKVEAFIGALTTRSKTRASARTRNEYLRACKQFAKWMVSDRRATDSPLTHLKSENVKTDRRHVRRPLVDDELRRLLTVTAGQPKRRGMTGRARVMLYRLAVETGLRANEIRTRRGYHFDFDGNPPSVAIEAAFAKGGEDDTLPLRAATASVLAAWCDGMDPQTLVFPHMPRNAAVMIRADLKAAGVAYRDDSGAVVDFHSLRHTFGTNLARAGVHPKLAQDLMRHSDINLTMNYYTHTLLVDRSAAVAGLPDFGDDAVTDAA